MRPDSKTGHPGRGYLSSRMKSLCALCRFLKDDTYVLYPFGYGLSYTTFSYSNLQMLNPGAEGCSNSGELPALCVLLTVTNSGRIGFKKPAEHVVPLYLTHTTLAVSADWDCLYRCAGPLRAGTGAHRPWPVGRGRAPHPSMSLIALDLRCTHEHCLCKTRLIQTGIGHCVDAC